MKKSLILTAALAILAGCAIQEPSQTIAPSGEKVTLTFSASTAESTKAYIGEASSNKYPVYWSEGDGFDFFIDGEYVAMAEDIEIDPTDATKATISVEIEAKDLEGASQILATYPIDAYWDGEWVEFPSEQTPEADGPDPASIIMSATCSPNDNLALSFKHEAAYAKMTITDIENGLPRTITLTAKSGTLLTSGTKYIELDPSNCSVSDSGELTIWFATLPVELSYFTLYLSYKNDENDVYRVVECSNNPLNLQAGCVTSFTVSCITPVEEEEDDSDPDVLTQDSATTWTASDWETLSGIYGTSTVTENVTYNKLNYVYSTKGITFKQSSKVYIAQVAGALADGGNYFEIFVAGPGDLSITAGSTSSDTRYVGVKVAGEEIGTYEAESGSSSFTVELHSIEEKTSIQFYSTNKGLNFYTITWTPWEADEIEESMDMSAYAKVDGYEYVDLGLPSGLLWAAYNVGASTIVETGDNFMWGDTTARTSEMTIENCPTYNLELEDFSGNAEYDAATYHWGGGWRTPTSAEMAELVENCDFEWLTTSGNGYAILTSKNNGNQLILHYTCWGYFEQFYTTKYQVNLWTSTTYYISETYPYSAGIQILFRSDNYILQSWTYRYYGFAIRPVHNAE